MLEIEKKRSSKQSLFFEATFMQGICESNLSIQKLPAELCIEDPETVLNWRSGHKLKKLILL